MHGERPAPRRVQAARCARCPPSGQQHAGWLARAVRAAARACPASGRTVSKHTVVDGLAQAPCQLLRRLHRLLWRQARVHPTKERDKLVSSSRLAGAAGAPMRGQAGRSICQSAGIEPCSACAAALGSRHNKRGHHRGQPGQQRHASAPHCRTLARNWERHARDGLAWNSSSAGPPGSSPHDRCRLRGAPGRGVRTVAAPRLDGQGCVAAKRLAN